MRSYCRNENMWVTGAWRIEVCPRQTRRPADRELAHLRHGGPLVPPAQRHQGNAAECLLVDGDRRGAAHLAEGGLPFGDPAWQPGWGWGAGMA